MVQCGEDTNGKMGITREEQDAYAKQSYTRAMEAYAEGILQKEIFEVVLPGSKAKDGMVQSKKVVAEDEELKKCNFAAMKIAQPLFKKPELTVTNWNCSKMGDGGSACVLMTREAAEKHGCTPLARIVGRKYSNSRYASPYL